MIDDPPYIRITPQAYRAVVGALELWHLNEILQILYRGTLDDPNTPPAPEPEQRADAD